MKNIILIAPPAAGKGTLSNSLSNSYGYLPLSTGDMLREKAKNDESLREAMKSGMLIDDNTVFSALEEQLNKIGDSLYILDGFPRTVEQAKMYDDVLSKLNRDLGVVIYLDVPKDELSSRVTSRLVCPKCKRSYSTRNKDLLPKIDGLCDDCGEVLIQRQDDSLETFEQRYNEYLEKTQPLIDYYKDKGVLVTINSSLPDETFNLASELIK